MSLGEANELKLPIAGSRDNLRSVTFVSIEESVVTIMLCGVTRADCLRLLSLSYLFQMTPIVLRVCIVLILSAKKLFDYGLGFSTEADT